MKRGSVYVLLDRMCDKGFVAYREEDNPASHRGLVRWFYKPTGLGARVLHDRQEIAAMIEGGELA